MKKTILILSIVALASISYGQKLKLTEAAVSYQNVDPTWMMKPDSYEQTKITLKESKKLIDEAYKEYIDKGDAHNLTKSKDLGKLFYFRGVIYLDYSGLAAIDETVKKEVEANAEEFSKIPFESLKKSMSITDYYNEEIIGKMNFLRGFAIQIGVQMFEEEKFLEAFDAFAGAVEMSDVIGYRDTVAMFNAGLAASKLDKFDDAIKYYYLAAQANYLGNAEVYRNIIQVVNKKNGGPSDETFKYIEEAKSKYPGDINIIIEEFNYHNSKGNTEAAQAALQAAIDKDPRNPIFHYSIGATFDEKANKLHEEGKHDEAKIFVEKSIEAYKKALEIDPKYVDAYYNLGVLYNNESYNLTEQIKSIEDVKIYNEKMKESRELLNEAIPYLKKSHELSPTDVNTLKLLKSIYFTLEMEAEYNETAAKLKDLGQ